MSGKETNRISCTPIPKGVVEMKDIRAGGGIVEQVSCEDSPTAKRIVWELLTYVHYFPIRL